MKADISIREPVYQTAEHLAQRLGMSLSELFEAALSAYVVAHQGEEVTEALNRVYETEISAMEPSMIKVQLVSVGGEAW